MQSIIKSQKDMRFAINFVTHSEQRLNYPTPPRSTIPYSFCERQDDEGVWRMTLSQECVMSTGLGRRKESGPVDSNFIDYQDEV